MANDQDFSAVLAQLNKQQQEAQQQRTEFKNVLDQLVQERADHSKLRDETTDSVSRSDFNKVLEELTRDREEARSDAREQLAQAHQRELDYNERESNIREEARKREIEYNERDSTIREEARQRELKNSERELASREREEKREKAQREAAREQQQEMAKLYQTMLNQEHPQAYANITDTPFEVTKKLEEQQKEISKLHQLLKVLQQNNAVTKPGQVVPVDNLPSLIAPQEATTTTIITPTTPIPTNNSSSVVHPDHSPAPPPTTEITVHTPIINSHTYQIQQTKDEWQSAAELLYSKRSNSHLKNYEHVTDFLAANPSLFEPLLERCPNIGLIIAHLLKLRLGLTVQNVSWTSSISDWNGEDCRRVGCSAAGFLRNFQTGEAALEAWKLHYVQVRERSERALWKTRNIWRH